VDCPAWIRPRGDVRSLFADFSGTVPQAFACMPAAAVASQDMQLFRQQALEHRNRLNGEIFLVPPVRWQAISWLLFGAVALAALFLILGSYSRTISANGVIRPSAGVASIVVPEDAVVLAVLARDGERVRKGQVIARLALPQSTDGRSLTEARRSAFAEQSAALDRQRQSAGAAIEERRRTLSEEIASEQRQVAAIDAQIASQRALITSSREELERIKDVAGRGFISGRDLQQRRELLITREQGLSELTQSRSQHQAALANARIALGELAARRQADLSGYDAQQAELRRETATLGNVGSIDLVASRDGILTTQRSRPGDAVLKGMSFGRIVPEGSDWQAQLRVPTSTITQLAPGNEVRLTLSAYPVADYGILKGVVEQVGAAPVEGAEPYYLVTARLAPLTATQRGRGVVLRPDLALSARIVLDRRSFLQWLVDPVTAVAKQ